MKTKQEKSSATPKRAVNSHTALLNIAKVWLYKWKRSEIYSLKDAYELEQAIARAEGKEAL